VGSLLPPPPNCKKRRSSVSEKLHGEAKTRLVAYPAAWPTSRWRDLSARGSIRRFLGGLTCSSSPLPSPARSSVPSESSEYDGGGGARRWSWSGGSWESLTTSLSLRRRRSETEEPAAPPSAPESELDGSGDGPRWRERKGEDDGEEGKGKKSSTSGREEGAAARRGRSERRGGGDGECPPRWWWWWWSASCDGAAPPLRRAGWCWCLSGDGDGDGDSDGVRGMAACLPACCRPRLGLLGVWFAALLFLARLSTFFLFLAAPFVCLAILSLASLRVHLYLSPSFHTLSLPIPISPLSPCFHTNHYGYFCCSLLPLSSGRTMSLVHGRVELLPTRYNRNELAYNYCQSLVDGVLTVILKSKRFDIKYYKYTSYIKYLDTFFLCCVHDNIVDL
jgi:hypothetical protein